MVRISYPYRRFTRRTALKGTAFGGLGAGTFALVGCGNDDDDDAAPTPTPSDDGEATPDPNGNGEGPRRGGILRLASGPLQANLDVHKAVGTNLFHWTSNFLVRYNLDGSLEPDVAESMPEITDDGSTLIFSLRPEVTWQDRPPVNGRSLTAEDVALTFERIKDPATGSPRAANYAVVESMDTPDEHTVVFNLSRPSAGLMAAMADQYDSIVPADYHGDPDAITRAEHVVGTGPYVLTEYEVGRGYKLERRADGHWRPDTAWIDGVDFTDIGAEGLPVANALRANQIDYGLIPAEEVPAFEGDGEYQMFMPISNANDVVQMNHNRPPYDDPRVRKAVFLALDRRRIYETVFGGLGSMGGPVTPASTFWALPEDELMTMPGFREDRDADIAEARQLMEAAGLGDGHSDVIRTVTRAQVNEVNELVVPMLAQIGFSLSVDDVGTDFAALIAFESGRDYNIATSVKQSGIDPDLQLNLYHHTDGSRNYTDHSNPDLDRVMEEQSAEFDTERRLELVHEIQRELIENPGPAWTGSRGWAIAVRDYVRNFSAPNWPDEYHRAEEMWLDI